MKRNFVSKKEFKSINSGDILGVRFMQGKAVAASTPSLTGMKDWKGDYIEVYSIKVRFESGPWKGETLRLIRQQINKI